MIGECNVYRRPKSERVPPIFADFHPQEAETPRAIEIPEPEIVEAEKSDESDETVPEVKPDEAIQALEPDGVVQSDTVKNLCRIFKAASEEGQLQFLQWTEINYKELWNEAFWAD